MLRQPSQPSSRVSSVGMISGLMTTVVARLRAGVLLEQRDEQAHALVHLRPREPDAVVLVHRLDHVVDQLLQEWVAEGGLVERLARARAAPDAPCARL